MLHSDDKCHYDDKVVLWLQNILLSYAIELYDLHLHLAIAYCFVLRENRIGMRNGIRSARAPYW